MDWMTVLVRFALYVVLMLVFGLPLFQLHALRKPERSSVLAKKFSNLAVALAVVGIFLSTISMVLMVKAMSGAVDISAIEEHMIEMMLTETSFGMAWCLVLQCWSSLSRQDYSSPAPIPSDCAS